MISFIYSTCRKYPKLEWFIDSLYNQVQELSYPTERIEIIIVDFHLQYEEERRKYISDIIQNRFNFIHVEPKPCPWQGKYKLTKRDYFCAGLARNTGCCYSKFNYICFVDDLSVMGPNLLSIMIENATHQNIVVYGYKKVFNLSVENGRILSLTEHQSGLDSRWNVCEVCYIDGGMFYGYSSMPLQTFLNLNGFDEICNGVAGEDYHLGVRLSKLNNSLRYDRRGIFYETEDIVGCDASFLRYDALLDDNLYIKLLKKFNIESRWDINGRMDISHLILDMLTRTKTWTEGNDYNLKELRDFIQSGGSFNIVFSDKLKTIDCVYLKDLDTNPIRHLEDDIPKTINTVQKKEPKFLWSRKFK